MSKNMITTALFLIGLAIMTVIIFLMGGNPLESTPIPAEQPVVASPTPFSIDQLPSPMPPVAGTEAGIASSSAE